MEFHYPDWMSALLEAEANLTTQNQITIPSAIRQALKLQGGKSRVRFQIQQGKVLVTRVNPPLKERQDPGLKPFLDLLTKDIKEQPERIKPFPLSLVKRARLAVKGVKIDLDEALTGED